MPQRLFASQNVSRFGPSIRLAYLMVVLAAWLPINTLHGSDTHEAFESPEPTWVVGHHDCPPLRVPVHERQFVDAHSGRGCEFMQVFSGRGTEIQIYHRLPPAPVIRELEPSVWMKADRRGPQLMARVVFPRSPGKDGKPLSAFLYGDSYQDVGLWRQLRVEKLAEKMQREVRVLRSRPGVLVDEREAYVDMLVLNIYTGAGSISLRLDDLELAGFATSGETKTNDPIQPQSEPPGETSSVVADTAGAVNSRIPQLQGNVLLTAGRPLFVRAVEHNGETFAFLQSLGFNAVLLGSPPTESQLSQAERSEIWLIAPPPLTSDSVEIDDRHAPVLAWNLGSRLTRSDEERVSRLIREIRVLDAQRPILLNVSSGWSRFRHEDTVMLYDRAVAATSFELKDFGSWISHVSQLGRTGGAFWCTVPTELPARLCEQIQCWEPGAAAASTLDPEQVRLMAFEAVSRGARGLCFQSKSRLDGKDAVTKFRVSSVRALNQELELIAPWVAGGTAVGETNTSRPQLRACTLQTERSRLLVVSRQASNQQFVPAATGRDSASFVVHGTQPSDQAYRLAVDGITPLTAERGGGVRITLDAARSIELVLLTQDPLAVNYVGRVSAEIRNDFAARQCEMLQYLVQETENVERLLTGGRQPSRNSPPNQQIPLAQIHADLERATQLSNSGDARNAIQICARAQNALRARRRGNWELAVMPFPDPVSSPLCTTYPTLPAHYAVAGKMAHTTWSVNVLAAGEMENLEHLLGSGWRQDRLNLPGLRSDVRLSLESPRSGRSALQMRVWSDGNGVRTTDGEWPITMTSAPISVRQGQILRINGWAKVPRPLEGSWDGLLIFDSQTGPELAESITQTQGWREFTLYRVAASSGDLSLIVAHTGIGDVWLDDLSITVSDFGLRISD